MRRGRTRSPKQKASFDEWVASVRRRIASDAGPPGAAPPDPRLRTAVQQAASMEERMAATRHRVLAPVPELGSARSLADQTQSRQDQLEELRNQRRDIESQLHQALSAKLHKKSEHDRITKSISNSAVMNERLKMSLTELRDKRDKYAAVIADQLQDLEVHEPKTDEDATLRENLEAAASWYNKFLGFQVIGGAEGVKFVFNKVNLQYPEKEYSFCIKIYNDTYSLVQCDPPIKDSEQLVKDLKLSGDLFKFVRVAREAFQASSVNVNIPVSSADLPYAPSLSFSPPAMMTFNKKSEDVPIQRNVPLTTAVWPYVRSLPFSPPAATAFNQKSEDVPGQSKSGSKNKKLPAKRRGTALSPSSTRHSPRLEGLRKQER